jgi:hypothetical protein
MQRALLVASPAPPNVRDLICLRRDIAHMCVCVYVPTATTTYYIK